MNFLISHLSVILSDERFFSRLKRLFRFSYWQMCVVCQGFVCLHGEKIYSLRQAYMHDAISVGRLKSVDIPMEMAPVINERPATHVYIAFNLASFTSAVAILNCT